ncbi:MAG: FtsW/RodA/SpoVE family cell cycle protein [Solirubrobacteraceae bacterium]|nr:FtsW/RodA/SpoVE family cell cycle protein [Solirubrobacteraceae bacterium]
MIFRRIRDLALLLPASLLVAIGFASVFANDGGQLSDLSLLYGAGFLGLCIVAHTIATVALPDADPYLLPLIAVLACFGLVELYRIDEDLARQQGTWFIIGIVAFTATIYLLKKDYRVLKEYRNLLALAGVILLLAPRLPGISNPENGAYLSVAIGPLAFQPTEVAKLCLVLYLASYLADNRQLLVQEARGPFGIFPPLKYLLPLLAVWGATMMMLFFIQDIGSAIMYFGVGLAMLYLATGRLLYPIAGLSLFAVGARMLYELRPTIQNRVDAWQDPFDPDTYERVGGSFQLAQSLFSQADGGFLGQGLGGSILQLSEKTADGQLNLILPAAKNDFIYALITNEVGLIGAVGLLLVYLLIVWRGFKVALVAHDSFSKLLAAGLATVFALQVFVIVGGVTKVIPLTGVTLPFVSAGGSSIVANFVLLALLLLVSDRARRDTREDLERAKSQQNAWGPGAEAWR